MQKNIVVCDDHILFSSGLSEILKTFGKNYVVNTFNDCDSCKNFINCNTIDVFICDLNIDNNDGFHLIEALKEQLENTKIIIVSAYFEEFLIQKAKNKGIHAFLKKETTAEELISVIEAPLKSPFYCSLVVPKPVSEFNTIDATVAIKFKISRQEKALIKLIIAGKTSNEIAIILNISKNTVDTHRKNINKKLALSNSINLINFANENNLFS